MKNNINPFKVSVCICAYNEQALIGKCLDSVLNQENVYIDEILVGINSSTDATADIVNKYCQIDKRIQIVNSSKGKVNAWNALNAMARNNLRFFQDGDCQPERNAYQQLLAVLDDNEIVGASIRRMTKGKNILIKIVNFPERFVRKQAYLNGPLYLIDYQKVIHCLKKINNKPQIPAEIINEDAFLQMICSAVEIKDDIFVNTTISGSMQDEIKRCQRMRLGELQLKEKYPELFEQKLARLREHSKLEQWLYLYRHITLREKIIFPLIMIIKFFIFYYINKMAKKVDHQRILIWK